MTADFPTDKTEAFQLSNECERIRKECPRFMAWLAKGVADTADTVCGSDGSAHWKHVGEFETLRQIYATITNPPKPDDTANSDGAGMVG